MPLLMLFALIAGAGTAITPCVLPVLPALLSASAVGGGPPAPGVGPAGARVLATARVRTAMCPSGAPGPAVGQRRRRAPAAAGNRARARRVVHGRDRPPGPAGPGGGGGRGAPRG